VSWLSLSQRDRSPLAAGLSLSPSMPCSSCSRFRRGAVGVTKAVLGVDRVRPQVLERRLAACQACPHRRRAKCALCTCYVGLKARVSSEVCPEGRW